MPRGHVAPLAQERQLGLEHAVVVAAVRIVAGRAAVDDRRVLQGRLTLVRYNNEPQFFVADAAVFYGLIADVLDRLVPQTDDETIDPETLTRIKDAIAVIERKQIARDRA